MCAAIRDIAPAPCRRLAVVDASPHGERDATGLLLADLAEALGVYARAWAEMPEPELVPMACPRAGAGDASALAGCDTMLLGYPLCKGALPPGLVDLLGRAATSLAPGTRVYALASGEAYEPERIGPSLSEVEGLCRAAGARWMGGVAVGGSPLVAATARTPRMGMARRRRSEAVDRLIFAMLAGEPAGVIDVRPPLPRWAYRLVAERGPRP